MRIINNVLLFRVSIPNWTILFLLGLFLIIRPTPITKEPYYPTKIEPTYNFYYFMARHEGIIYKIYNDFGKKVLSPSKQSQTGFLTIGIGHKLTDAEIVTHCVKWGNVSVYIGSKLNFEEAKLILSHDIIQQLKIIERVIKVPLKSNEFDALASMAYNLGYNMFFNKTNGIPDFKKPTGLLKALNSQQKEQVYIEILKYTKSQGKVLPGLVKRRTAEAELFLRGKYE
jgi:GH24 family phage-related lysozyme (muramidase)